ncbi:hypothetical protein Q9R30_05605 [Arthrobacter sp. AB6]|nr:hypothetical protein [Arthrobacter sp. AB6]MDT0194829.1 hypothetical protein [Arthrobacter sp. AB6]
MREGDPAILLLGYVEIAEATGQDAGRQSTRSSTRRRTLSKPLRGTP